MKLVSRLVSGGGKGGRTPMILVQLRRTNTPGSNKDTFRCKMLRDV